MAAGVEEKTAKYYKNDARYVAVSGEWMTFKLGKDAHLTREAAVADANKRRDAKIKSLEKHLAAARAKVFE